ncbi:MAG: C-GCAxxG-C-C family protein [Candidatus Marinimicrobia bacterium]|nr:C-GCAxxG-C-C family protein [Candidatus Neomarinimicrobiota bacterium]
MMERCEEAVKIFNNGFNCAQAVLSVFADEFGLDRTIALRIAGGFGGGMGRQGLICGAVTGAMMVIGLKYGKILPEDNAAREKAYNTVMDFSNRFKAQYGSLTCRDLLGYDISKPEERELIHANKLTESICAPIINTTVKLLEQIINS